MNPKNLITSTLRFINGLRRPTKKENMQKLHERGETIDSFTFRDVMESDAPLLGKLHALTWAQNASTLGVHTTSTLFTTVTLLKLL